MSALHFQTGYDCEDYVGDDHGEDYVGGDDGKDFTGDGDHGGCGDEWQLGTLFHEGQFYA